jgi:hypothetical protein
MKNATIIVALAALAATILPSCLYFLGVIEHDSVKIAALIGTALWFASAPLWIGRELPVDAKEVEI